MAEENAAQLPVEDMSEEVRSGESQATFCLQVQLETGWQNMGNAEQKQLYYHLAAGVRRFTLLIRGGAYLIDLSRPDRLRQVNMASGRVRQLRFLGAAPPGLMLDDSAEALRQRSLGAQSRRGDAPQGPINDLSFSPHFSKCFQELQANEIQLCGKWAVFYHAYSFSALIYEVQAAIAALLFQFDSQQAPLPRLLMHEFGELPNAGCLLKKFKDDFSKNLQDHHPTYRAVALSVMCSLVALGPEVSPAVLFLAGYSCEDLSFMNLLKDILAACQIPQEKLERLCSDIVAVSEQHGLDVSRFGGKPCKSNRPGHLLQIFIRRDLLDEFAYASKPYGELDADREPLSRWLGEDNNANWGQARVVAHPRLFMQPDSVRMYLASADAIFHEQRQNFQHELTQLLKSALVDAESRKRATLGISGSMVPAYSSESTRRKKTGAASRIRQLFQRKPRNR